MAQKKKKHINYIKRKSVNGRTPQVFRLEKCTIRKTERLEKTINIVCLVWRSWFNGRQL